MTDFLHRLIHGKKPRREHSDVMVCAKPYSECETCKLYDWCYAKVDITIIKKM
jgi:hypothetical protein